MSDYFTTLVQTKEHGFCMMLIEVCIVFSLSRPGIVWVSRTVSLTGMLIHPLYLAITLVILPLLDYPLILSLVSIHTHTPTHCLSLVLVVLI